MKYCPACNMEIDEFAQQYFIWARNLNNIGWEKLYFCCGECRNEFMNQDRTEELNFDRRKSF